MEKIITTIMFCATLAGVVFYGVNNYLDFKRSELKAKAVDDCMRANTIETRYTVGETEAVRQEMINDLYDKCMKDKGIK